MTTLETPGAGMTKFGAGSGPDPLQRAAASGSLAELESAWLEALGAEWPATNFLRALATLPTGQRGGAAGSVSLLLLLLESLQKRKRHGEVIEVVRALHPFAQQKVDLRQTLLAALQGQHGQEAWLPLFLELSGLTVERGDLLDTYERFGRLARFVPGNVVYHRSGWGEGLIDAHDLPQKGFHVEFRQDRQRRFMPFTTGLDVLTVLDREDLRARLLVDVEGLRREAEEVPERLLHAVARLHKGRAGVKEIKQLLAGAVIEEKSWNSWWKKAKVAAARDPFLAVENPARPVFVLRSRALTPEEDLRGGMQRAQKLSELLTLVRGPLSLDPQPAVKQMILNELSARLPAERDPAARIEAALQLVRHGAQPLDFAARLIEQVVASGTSFVALAESLPEAGLRREALDAFMQSRPKLWSDAIVGEMSQLPPQLLDVVCDRLVAEGRADTVTNRFHIYLLSPSRHPAAVMRLVRRFAELPAKEGVPTLHEMLLGLLHLAETQAPRAARGDKDAKEIMRQLEEVLLQRRGGVAEAFAKVGSRAELAGLLAVMKRCRSMPDEIVYGLRRAFEARFPDLAPKDEVPFWEGNGIFCTRAGIARRQEEYRVLLHEKIPANSADIGRAAAYGDLSENYEWTAAIEQQRQLTEKAAAMEAELKLAQALEDQVLPPNLVAPGTRVGYEQDGKLHTVTILGPWDPGEGVVSYRAPLAAGMLGSRVGESMAVTLPSGQITVVVKSIDPGLS
ncbi:MAG: GreA/GreB family elongation factor [Planctomycetota bacterium]